MREVEPAVQAWREVAGEAALAAAEQLGDEMRQGRIRGPLHGIPVGIKDIIDVAGLPTRGNSRARADVAPAAVDAEVVARLRLAGAVVLGKTHTTEFAYFDPSPARNPHNIRSEEHTSELQSLMRSSYAVFCLRKQTRSQAFPEHHEQRSG